jgi:type VI secretion system protein VasD
MSPTIIDSLKIIALAWLVTSFTGCGLTQSATESTASTAKAIFHKQVKTLHLDFSARTAMNTDALDMNGLAVPTLVRVYQLRDGRAAQKASYEQLLSDDDSVLRNDLLDSRAVVVNPGEGAQISVPMDKDARFISVVALFRQSDNQINSWRLTLPRDDLHPDRARVIELGDNRLTLRPLAKE